MEHITYHSYVELPKDDKHIPITGQHLRNRMNTDVVFIGRLSTQKTHISKSVGSRVLTSTAICPT